MVPIEAHSWTISVIPELLSTFRVAAHRGSATIHITTCGHPISSHGWPVASLAMHAIFVIEVSSLLASSFVVLGAKGHSVLLERLFALLLTMLVEIVAAKFPHLVRVVAIFFTEAWAHSLARIPALLPLAGIVRSAL